MWNSPGNDSHPRAGEAQQQRDDDPGDAVHVHLQGSGQGWLPVIVRVSPHMHQQ